MYQSHFFYKPSLVFRTYFWQTRYKTVFSQLHTLMATYQYFHNAKDCGSIQKKMGKSDIVHLQFKVWKVILAGLCWKSTAYYMPTDEVWSGVGRVSKWLPGMLIGSALTTITWMGWPWNSVHMISIKQKCVWHSFPFILIHSLLLYALDIHWHWFLYAGILNIFTDSSGVTLESVTMGKPVLSIVLKEVWGSWQPF